jgi:hypothetical protein
MVAQVVVVVLEVVVFILIHLLAVLTQMVKAIAVEVADQEMSVVTLVPLVVEEVQVGLEETVLVRLILMQEMVAQVHHQA